MKVTETETEIIVDGEGFTITCNEQWSFSAGTTKEVIIKNFNILSYKSFGKLVNIGGVNLIYIGENKHKKGSSIFWDTIKDEIVII